MLSMSLLGCTPTTPTRTPPEETTVTTTTVTDTGNTAPNCTPAAALVQTHPMLVFEDIEFLADGRLVTGANDHLLVYTHWGEEMTQFGFGLGVNPTGIRVLVSGDIAVADVFEGTISLVDGDTGGVSVLASSLSNPNGLAAARDGSLYASEHISGGRVLHVDAESGDVDVVAAWTGSDAPNGLALNATDDVLFVAVGSRIDRVDLTDGSVTVLHAFEEGDFDSVAVDVCGSVYAVSYFGGVLHRIAPDGTDEVLLTLSNDAYFSGMRWGVGTGGSARDRLYLSAQHSSVTEVQIGVNGVPPVF